MSNVEIKMRFNSETEEVETLVDGKVLVSSGSETFASWVEWHNEKHKPTVEEPVDEKVVDTSTAEVISLDEPVVEDEVDTKETA